MTEMSLERLRSELMKELKELLDWVLDSNGCALRKKLNSFSNSQSTMIAKPLFEDDGDKLETIKERVTDPNVNVVNKEIEDTLRDAANKNDDIRKLRLGIKAITGFYVKIGVATYKVGNIIKQSNATPTPEPQLQGALVNNRSYEFTEDDETFMKAIAQGKSKP